MGMIETIPPKRPMDYTDILNSCKFFLKGCDPFCPCRFSTELFICLQTPAIRRVPNKLYFKDIHVYKSCLLYGKTLINKMPTVIKETN